MMHSRLGNRSKRLTVRLGNGSKLSGYERSKALLEAAQPSCGRLRRLSAVVVVGKKQALVIRLEWFASTPTEDPRREPGPPVQVRELVQCESVGTAVRENRGRH